MSRLGVRLLTIAKALGSVVRSSSPSARPPARILIAHNLLLGDTVLLAPLLKSLAARYPAADRVVLVRPAVAALFSGKPYGWTAMPYDRRDPASQRSVLDSGPYDLAIVPDDNRYAWLAKAAGARRVVAFAADRPWWKNAMVDRAVPYPPTPGTWADIAASLLHDGPTAIDPPPFVPGEWPAPVATSFVTPAEPYAVLHVGASTPLKQWPADRWNAIAAGLRLRGLRVAWSGGADERPILASVDVRPEDADYVGALDLAQLWHLLSGARVLLCPDTGIAHLARLVGVRTVAMFGPGSIVTHGPGRFWRHAPFTVVTAEDYPCRDQHVLFRRDVAWVRRCGRRFDPHALPQGRSGNGACGRPSCMEAITTTAVESTIDG